MGDVHAEHAPEGLVDPAVAWGTLGAHVVNARGARRACGGGGVSVRSLTNLLAALQASSSDMMAMALALQCCAAAYAPPCDMQVRPRAHACPVPQL
jgi:hypothetical protein